MQYWVVVLAAAAGFGCAAIADVTASNATITVNSSGTMRALKKVGDPACGPPDFSCLKVVDTVPKPVANQGEILVRVTSSSYNPDEPANLAVSSCRIDDRYILFENHSFAVLSWTSIVFLLHPALNPTRATPRCWAFCL